MRITGRDYVVAQFGAWVQEARLYLARARHCEGEARRECLAIARDAGAAARRAFQQMQEVTR